MSGRQSYLSLPWSITGTLCSVLHNVIYFRTGDFVRSLPRATTLRDFLLIADSCYVSWQELQQLYVVRGAPSLRIISVRAG